MRRPAEARSRGSSARCASSGGSTQLSRLQSGAGVSASLTPGKDGVPAPWMVTPGVSVSHEALPIRLIGGVSVPVGPGSEGMEPVFGLSIGTSFEFLGDKKKKK